MQSLTTVEIPCCLCGVLIAPNAANQCMTCLAQDCDLAGRLQRGPAGAHTIDVHQCRQCRRFQQTPKHYIPADPESPELLALCLKHIPALQSTASPKLHLVDAGFIWTEPHSSKFANASCSATCACIVYIILAYNIVSPFLLLLNSAIQGARDSAHQLSRRTRTATRRRGIAQQMATMPRL